MMKIDTNWKRYQRRLQKKTLRARLVRTSAWVIIPLVVLLFGIQFSNIDLSVDYFTNAAGTTTTAKSLFSKEDFWHLITPESVINATANQVDITYQDQLFSLETTINTDFQQYMMRRLRSSKSPAVAFVAIDPANGEVVSLVEFNKMADIDHVCLSGQFPAASVFKIVSAAAAIEERDYKAKSTLTYNGRKHTLYKNQLKKSTNRYTNRVSLQTSFAKSINPAFGKLGIYQLKKELLGKYAARFGFNEPIGFELPMEPSGFTVGDDPYQWAEIACGFNRTTVISPIHGALMVAAIMNDGELIEPTIVHDLRDKNNTPIYYAPSRNIRNVFSANTSHELQKLMKATITGGTSRRTFRGHARDRVLSRIIIGGKTGSIKNRTDDLLYDWFVGFGAEKKGERKLAVAVLVVHDTLLRTRAQEYGRLALRNYFRKRPGA